MEKIQYDMLYLAACGVRGICPLQERVQDMDIQNLYRMSCVNSMEALVGMVLQKAAIELPKEWSQKIAKAVRKTILFDMERTKILSFMEQKGIWYLPLKGVILKELYPAVGMRQMSDNDILFDEKFRIEVRDYMQSQGYEVEYFDKGNHDVYKKEPIYNFELHSALYGWPHPEKLIQYYENVKERLILDSGSSYGYHFSDEDFYVHTTSHGYKHYVGGGTGIRTLLDFYVYLKAKPGLDFAYIERECEMLGIAEYEKQSRILCEKVFDGVLENAGENFEQHLSQEEKEMFAVYMQSGVYGNSERRIKNSVERIRQENKSFPKLRYLWKRLFPGPEMYKKYLPAAKKHKWLLPLGWLIRVVLMVFEGRSKKILNEMKKVKKL